MSRAYLWLTEDEAAELSADLRAVMKKHTADRDAEHHPDGTRRVFCSSRSSRQPRRPPEPAAPRLGLLPLRSARQPARLTRRPHALGVRVPPLRVVALGKEQHVVAHRRQPPAAQRARVGGGLEVLRAAELPPAGSARHFPVVVVVGVGGTGHLKPLRFSVRQLLETTFGPLRARATLSTSLEMVTT